TPGTVAGSGQAAQQGEPPAQQKSGPATTATTEAIDSAGGAKLPPAQRPDVEQGVRRSLPYTAEFGPMAATVSRITSKSYIVCGWVKGANSAAGYRSFLAMYVPYMRIGLLLAISGKQTEERISRRCDNEGAPLPPQTKATET